jgi:hypothetical protein
VAWYVTVFCLFLDMFLLVHEHASCSVLAVWANAFLLLLHLLLQICYKM